MGGIGSGTWCRWETKITVEDCKKIDIRLMIRRAWLIPGRSGSLTWTRNGEPWGDISHESYDDRLILIYHYRENRKDWHPVRQEVFFSRTDCNYGGKRKWFLCPSCNRRCAILYSASKLFLCRKCYNLPYESQMKGEIDRLIDQKHKLGDRIFDNYDGYGYRKCKGMHQKTFDTLYNRWTKIENRIDNMIFLRYGALMK